MAIGTDPAGIIESTGIDHACIGESFESEADIRAAFRAEVQLEPTSRLIRDGAEVAEFPGDLDLLRPEKRFDRKCTAGSSLTPGAVTDGDTHRIPMGSVPYRPAQTAAFMHVGRVTIRDCHHESLESDVYDQLLLV